MGKIIGNVDLTKKIVDNDETRRMKRLMKELGDMYAVFGPIVPREMQLMANKLRDEFRDESGVLHKKQSLELNPVMKEFDQLTEKVRGYQTTLREMGRRHKMEDHMLAIKFLELEMKVIRPAVEAKQRKSPIMR